MFLFKSLKSGKNALISPLENAGSPANPKNKAI